MLRIAPQEIDIQIFLNQQQIFVLAQQTVECPDKVVYLKLLHIKYQAFITPSLSRCEI
jgi:hypothetical protein